MRMVISSFRSHGYSATKIDSFFLKAYLLFQFGISSFNGQYVYVDSRKMKTNFLKYLEYLGSVVLVVSNVIQDPAI